MTLPYPVTILVTMRPVSNAGNLDTSASTVLSTNAPPVSNGPLAMSKPVVLSDDARPPGKHIPPLPLAEAPLVIHALPTWSLPNLVSPLASHRLDEAIPRPRLTSMME